MQTQEPTATELKAIHAAGEQQGSSMDAFAGQCPFQPQDTQRHKAWMVGFGDGRAKLGR